jgi:hypothetical protein
MGKVNTKKLMLELQGIIDSMQKEVDRANKKKAVKKAAIRKQAKV